eukprot:6213821-Pleurochrysis_carterae.AAC.2
MLRQRGEQTSQQDRATDQARAREGEAIRGCFRDLPALAEPPLAGGFSAGVADNGSTSAEGKPVAARARLWERVTLEEPTGG